MNSRRGSFILILIIVAGTIIYFWYDGKPPFLKGKNFSFNVVPSDLSGFAQKTGDFVKGLKDKSGSTTKDIFRAIAEKPKEIASNVVSEVKKSAVESFKSQIAETLGLATNSNNSPPKNVAIVRQVSQGLSLSIESGEEGVKYFVEWGDGEKTEDSLEPKQQKTLEHIWKTVGDYLVKVEVENVKSNDKKSYIFPLKILKP